MRRLSLIEKRLFYSASSQRENTMSCCALWNFPRYPRARYGSPREQGPGARPGTISDTQRRPAPWTSSPLHFNRSCASLRPRPRPRPHSLAISVWLSCRLFFGNTSFFRACSYFRKTNGFPRDRSRGVVMQKISAGVAVRIAVMKV